MSDLLREAKSSCPYCGTGCGVIVQARGNQIVSVRGDPVHPANFGKLCPKGQTLHLTATQDVLARARLLHPQLRDSRAAPRRRVDWDAALDHAADRFAQVLRERGPDAVAFYVSGQLLTEDYYVFNKLARALVGTNNIDSNSRLCMSSTVVGYKRTLGADAPPCSYEDLELADCVFVAGANPAAAHPVLFGRVLEAKRRRGTRLIVADPRRTESAAAADLHLPVRPGTDLWLFTAMLGVMVRDGLADRSFIAGHTDGFESVAASARQIALADAQRITAVPALDIQRAARWFARAPAALSLYCQGLNQSSHGTDNNAALIHLHLATGQIGRPGAGPFSLTGQPNAMGGRETGTMATLLPGHRDPMDEADRFDLARRWGIETLPARRGLSAVEMFDACANGDIGALWIACTNPAQSLPDLTRVHAALQRVPFVVVQESFANTETAAFADLLLPAATFGEREGTSTNSERRITLSRAAVAAPGEARADWRIAADFARRLAARVRPQLSEAFDFADAAAVFDEYRALTAGRDLDIGGLDYSLLEQAGPQQWPVPQRREDGLASTVPGTARLYADLRFATPDGRARFVPIELRGAAEHTDSVFPLALTTVRLRDQWHGASRSGEVTTLEMPPAVVELAPATLAECGVADDDLVELSTTRARLILPVRANENLPRDVASLPMHFGARWLPASTGGVNLLTAAELDPLSLQPELKYAAARVERVDLPWHVALVGCIAPDRIGAVLEALRSHAQACSYASVVRFGRDPQRAGVALLVANPAPLTALMEAARSAFAIAPDAPTLRDARAGRARTVSVVGGRLASAMLEGRSRADIRAWSVYRRLIDQGTDCSQRSLRELFAPVEA
jgi:assimilatory nitrate reductase catalytic subunit